MDEFRRIARVAASQGLCVVNVGYRTGELADWFLNAAKGIADAFDRRNGSDLYAKLIPSRRHVQPGRPHHNAVGDLRPALVVPAPSSRDDARSIRGGPIGRDA